jgi:ketosteroid isomerase-like protein/heme-degrading monooxygenase HmoA
MKKLILLFVGILFVSCNSNPDYEKNLATAKKWVQAFEDGNIDLWREVVSEDVQDIAPMYGMGQVDYNTSLQVAEFYVQNYTDVKFNDPVWLPGIDTLTMKPDGSVRAYGRWSGKSLSTGREFSLMSYHNFDFEDGKISSTGEYFDATGMVNAVGPVQRSVIVVSADIKEGKYEAFQELMKSEAGLKTTRNYEGCNHVESFFNEESNKYIVIEHWDSYELYNAYADWRFNEDPSGLVKEMIPLLNGGENGISIFSNNSGYGFY